MRTKLELFRDKTAEINFIALCSISIFLRHLGYSGIFALFQSHCCLRIVYDLCICPSWTECRGHLSCAAALTQGQESPCVSCVSLAAAYMSCCNHTVQPFLVTAAASHPSPAPFTWNRLCGSSLCWPGLWNAADTIAMTETLCLSALAKFLVSLAPKWPWKITPTALTLFLRELSSNWEELRILLHQNNPANES